MTMTETAENLNETEKLRRKLRYRSWHRGTREMDLIMGRFADAHLDSFTHDQLVTYEDLLQENDPDLYNWLTGREAVPAEKNSEIMQLLLG
jgi:antitoxin CptB